MDAAAFSRPRAPLASARAPLKPSEPRKRKRGALQDISNSSHARSTAASAAHAVTKPATKRPSVANVRARSAAPKVPVGAASMGAKRRRENPNANNEDGKVQSRLVSFQAVTTKKETKKNEERVDAEQADKSDGKEKEEPLEMECLETLKVETTEPEPTPTAPPVTTTRGESKQELAPTKTETQPKNREPVPPYEPRPYAFKFDHRDSGFDEDTYKSQINDIDEPFLNSATYCVKIARDIDRFHRQHEMKYHPEPDYIGNVQVDINEKMRTILVDWLVEVGEEYELDSQTFHKTVNLVDRCLTKFKINRKQFQLLGCACMMIAAKFEEVYGPNVDEFVYISDQTYTSEEMLEMESKVLQALEYRIASTTCHGFLPRFMRAGCTNDKQKFLVQYLCDFAILYYHMLQYRPSMLAASAVYLSRLMTKEEQPWTPTLHHFTQFNAWELKDCVMDLFRLHRAENEIVENQRDKAKAVSEKYVADKFLSVSTMSPVDEALLEQSFLAYEMPKHMRRKQQATETSSGSE